MRKQFLSVLAFSMAILILTVVSGIWSATKTVEASIEKTLPPFTVNASAKTVPSGTRVNFTIGGANCPCSGAKVATAGRSGTATANFTVNCRPKITKTCVIHALASTDSGDNYKGSSKPTLSKSGKYLASVTMAKY